MWDFCGNSHMWESCGNAIGIPTEILWKWDGNENSLPTATLPGDRRNTTFALTGIRIKWYLY